MTNQVKIAPLITPVALSAPPWRPSWVFVLGDPNGTLQWILRLEAWWKQTSKKLNIIIHIISLFGLQLSSRTSTFVIFVFFSETSLSPFSARPWDRSCQRSLSVATNSAWPANRWFAARICFWHCAMELSDLKNGVSPNRKNTWFQKCLKKKMGKKKTYQNSSSLKNYKNLILQFWEPRSFYSWVWRASVGHWYKLRIQMPATIVPKVNHSRPGNNELNKCLDPWSVLRWKGIDLLWNYNAIVLGLIHGVKLGTTPPKTKHHARLTDTPSELNIPSILPCWKPAPKTTTFGQDCPRPPLKRARHDEQRHHPWANMKPPLDRRNPWRKTWGIFCWSNWRESESLNIIYTFFLVISENILQVEFTVYNTGGMVAPCVFEMSTSFHNVTP